MIQMKYPEFALQNLHPLFDSIKMRPINNTSTDYRPVSRSNVSHNSRVNHCNKNRLNILL